MFILHLLEALMLLITPLISKGRVPNERLTVSDRTAVPNNKDKWTEEIVPLTCLNLICPLRGKEILSIKCLATKAKAVPISRSQP
jgi:hypothetical protein